MKTHGVTSFQDLSTTIATSWKQIDDETFQFVTTITSMVKQRLGEANGAKEHGSVAPDLALHASLSPPSPVPLGTVPDSQMYTPLPNHHLAQDVVPSIFCQVIQEEPQISNSIPRMESRAANLISIAEVEMDDNEILTLWSSF